MIIFLTIKPVRYYFSRATLNCTFVNCTAAIWVCFSIGWEVRCLMGLAHRNLESWVAAAEQLHSHHLVRYKNLGWIPLQPVEELEEFWTASPVSVGRRETVCPVVSIQSNKHRLQPLACADLLVVSSGSSQPSSTRFWAVTDGTPVPWLGSPSRTNMAIRRLI